MCPVTMGYVKHVRAYNFVSMSPTVVVAQLCALWAPGICHRHSLVEPYKGLQNFFCLDSSQHPRNWLQRVSFHLGLQYHAAHGGKWSDFKWVWISPYGNESFKLLLLTTIPSHSDLKKVSSLFPAGIVETVIMAHNPYNWLNEGGKF